ncbi:AmmeMemoRadiSam system protein B [Aliifodinibius sp. S!AR15-10]|uniref:AmmeMemoRadiSam system protein B n=1 Tax=Aliifodinibius sp. S!AR15-10 TaxID=2950437 RepID=UPI00285551F6|nr:AmmeMemoRadiSam system protein B [Aliifodinibius sp. S!AR15-10]MDR8392814.1 AmmeMemoRadiSam system protein B [Aliifodinibius sp. S!AR15-10]
MSKNGKLFDSKTDPLPRIRPELDIIPVENNGDSYLYFHDSMGYATDNFALNRQAGPLLSLLDGQKSIEQLKPHLGEGVTADQLLEYIQFLDKNRLLLTPHFKQHADQVEEEYESSSVHSSITAGNSYPANPDELRTFLDDAFTKHENTDIDADSKGIKALYAPHIDPRVGLDSYVKAFSAIREMEPKRVVVLATSHYSGMHPDLYQDQPFIVSRKNFELPLGTIKADKTAIDELLQAEGLGVTGCDRAHRIEHSIELHLLFLSYLWDHDFEIVPVLVRGFDELLYMEDGHLAGQVEKFGNYLNEQFGEDNETLFLISGDLAHIGKKFGDPEPASNMFSEVKSFDRMFMTYSEKGDRESMLNLMREQHDPYRICGFAPLYSFLNAIPDVKGEQLTYDLWDETERESAVSFGSILYRK